MAARPWALQRSTTTTLQSVGKPTASSSPEGKSAEAVLGKARAAIAREARDSAIEFAMALRKAGETGGGGGTTAALDFAGFVSFEN